MCAQIKLEIMTTLIEKVECVKRKIAERCTLGVIYLDVVREFQLSEIVGLYIAKQFLHKSNFQFFSKSTGNNVDISKCSSIASNDLLCMAPSYTYYKTFHIDSPSGGTGEGDDDDEGKKDTNNPVTQLFAQILEQLAIAKEKGLSLSEITKLLPQVKNIGNQLDRLIMQNLIVKKFISTRTQSKEKSSRCPSQCNIYFLVDYADKYRPEEDNVVVLVSEEIRSQILAVLREIITINRLPFMTTTDIGRYLRLRKRSLQSLRSQTVLQQKRSTSAADAPPVVFYLRYCNPLANSGRVGSSRVCWCFSETKSHVIASDEPSAKLSRIRNLPLFESIVHYIYVKKEISSVDVRQLVSVNRKRAGKLVTEFMNTFKFPSVKKQEGKTIMYKLLPPARRTLAAASRTITAKQAKADKAKTKAKKKPVKKPKKKKKPVKKSKAKKPKKRRRTGSDGEDDDDSDSEFEEESSESEEEEESESEEEDSESEEEEIKVAEEVAELIELEHPEDGDYGLVLYRRPSETEGPQPTTIPKKLSFEEIASPASTSDVLNASNAIASFLTTDIVSDNYGLTDANTTKHIISTPIPAIVAPDISAVTPSSTVNEKNKKGTSKKSPAAKSPSAIPHTPDNATLIVPTTPTSVPKGGANAKPKKGLSQDQQDRGDLITQYIQGQPKGIGCLPDILRIVREHYQDRSSYLDKKTIYRDILRLVNAGLISTTCVVLNTTQQQIFLWHYKEIIVVLLDAAFPNTTVTNSVAMAATNSKQDAYDSSDSENPSKALPVTPINQQKRAPIPPSSSVTESATKSSNISAAGKVVITEDINAMIQDFLNTVEYKQKPQYTQPPRAQVYSDLPATPTTPSGDQLEFTNTDALVVNNLMDDEDAGDKKSVEAKKPTRKRKKAASSGGEDKDDTKPLSEVVAAEGEGGDVNTPTVTTTVKRQRKKQVTIIQEPTDVLLYDTNYAAVGADAVAAAASALTPTPTKGKGKGRGGRSRASPARVMEDKDQLPLGETGKKQLVDSNDDDNLTILPFPLQQPSPASTFSSLNITLGSIMATNTSGTLGNDSSGSSDAVTNAITNMTTTNPNPLSASAYAASARPFHEDFWSPEEELLLLEMFLQNFLIRKARTGLPNSLKPLPYYMPKSTKCAKSGFPSLPVPGEATPSSDLTSTPGTKKRMTRGGHEKRFFVTFPWESVLDLQPGNIVLDTLRGYYIMNSTEKLPGHTKNASRNRMRELVKTFTTLRQLAVYLFQQATGVTACVTDKANHEQMVWDNRSLLLRLCHFVLTNTASSIPRSPTTPPAPITSSSTSLSPSACLSRAFEQLPLETQVLYRFFQNCGFYHRPLFTFSDLLGHPSTSASEVLLIEEDKQNTTTAEKPSQSAGTIQDHQEQGQQDIVTSSKEGEEQAEASSYVITTTTLTPAATTTTAAVMTKEEKMVGKILREFYMHGLIKRTGPEEEDDLPNAKFQMTTFYLNSLLVDKPFGDFFLALFRHHTDTNLTSEAVDVDTQVHQFLLLAHHTLHHTLLAGNTVDSATQHDLSFQISVNSTNNNNAHTPVDINNDADHIHILSRGKSSNSNPLPMNNCTVSFSFSSATLSKYRLLATDIQHWYADPNQMPVALLPWLSTSNDSDAAEVVVDRVMVFGLQVLSLLASHVRLTFAQLHDHLLVLPEALLHSLLDILAHWELLQTVHLKPSPSILLDDPFAAGDLLWNNEDSNSDSNNSGGEEYVVYELL